jgi:hypothetical protein
MRHVCGHEIVVISIVKPVARVIEDTQDTGSYELLYEVEGIHDFLELHVTIREDFEAETFQRVGERKNIIMRG